MAAKRSRGLSVLFVILLLFIAALPLTAGGNAAAPPNLVIVVDRAPDDLVIEVDGIASMREDFYGKAFYGVWFDGMPGAGDVPQAERHLVAKKGDQTVALDFSDDGSHYRRTYVLNFSTAQIESIETPFSWIDMFLRLFVTLILEGLLFFLLGFRKKRSWIVFFVVNVLTQLLLTWALSSNPFLSAMRRSPSPFWRYSSSWWSPSRI